MIPVAILVAGIFYYVVNPTTVSLFIPKCVWRLLTGTQCPACGSQRALNALVHGHLGQALSYNYFFILSIPYALVAVLVSWYNFGHSLDGLKRLAFHPITLKAYVILFFAWWIARNIFNL